MLSADIRGEDSSFIRLYLNTLSHHGVTASSQRRPDCEGKVNRDDMWRGNLDEIAS
jgi:hypothetical protein